MTLTVAQYQAVLMRQYPQKRLAEMFFRKARVLALIKKADDFEGDDMGISVEVAPTTGGSATFSDAQASIGGTTHRRFLLTRKADYSLYRIRNQVLRASRSKKGAVVKATDSQMRAAMNVITTSMGISTYRNGGGYRGVIQSGGGTPTLTLTELVDMRNFEVGMQVQPSATDGTSGAVIADIQTITAIDRTARTITRSGGNWDAGNYANGNYIFRRGDFGNMLTGFGGWLPLTAPTAGDSFNGVDRSIDVQRLAGNRYVGTIAADLTLERCLNNAVSEQIIYGGNPDVILLNTLDLAILKNQLSGKINYDKLSAKMPSGSKAEISFKTIVLASDEGDVNVMGDPFCPRGLAYSLDLSSWTLHHLGACPGFITEDGDGIFQRAYNDDAQEARIGSYHELECEAPGHNSVIDISELTANAA